MPPISAVLACQEIFKATFIKTLPFSTSDLPNFGKSEARALGPCVLCFEIDFLEYMHISTNPSYFVLFPYSHLG